MEFINALIDLYKAALANLDFVYNLGSFWGTVVGCLVFKRQADWGDRANWLITGYFFSRYIGPPVAKYTFPDLEEAIRFSLAMFFSFILAGIVKIFEYVGGDPKFIPAIIKALLPSFIANKLEFKDEKMNLLLNILVTGQHMLALTWLHWLHVTSVGALMYFLIRGFHMLRPNKSWAYRILEWGVVLTLSAYLAALVTNSPESKTSVQDLIEPWIFFFLAVGALYSVSKWPGIVQEAIKQQLTPERDYWRLALQAGGVLVAGLFSLGLLSSGIEDVKQNQKQEIAIDSTAARQTMAMRKENARLKTDNALQKAKQDTLIDP